MFKYYLLVNLMVVLFKEIMEEQEKEQARFLLIKNETKHIIAFTGLSMKTFNAFSFICTV